ncbi:alpha-amylase [Cohnella xylanilytica]|uniref:Alpha-amylase n=1 Tax=Cohnella xylanilytica TaxID=557555 RepID=A0A841TXQ8_9BACL|nr:alpha-amylase family glycosyl hydrolase [Cohnella xylanilytica]MBB6690650.1 alpha-amylase [Cohnella xylanilytica]
MSDRNLTSSAVSRQPGTAALPARLPRPAPNGLPNSPGSKGSDPAIPDPLNYCSDVIYQICTDRFAGGRFPLGASPAGTKLYCGGDWPGLVGKLEDGYFSRLGVTALWISQPVDNIDAVVDYEGVKHTSYHGYWARDFKRTNARFGSFDDFRRLVAAAHDRGIKIVIDFAPNHTSPAMETDPSFAENGRLYDDGRLLGGYTGDAEGLFHHNGGTDFLTTENDIYRNLYDMADLNHLHPVIDRYFKEAIRLWLDLGIDGIRVDAVKHMPAGWQKNWLASIYGCRPVFVFGEWFLGSPDADPEHAKFANKSGMSLLDFRLSQQVRRVFRDRTATMYDLDETILATVSDYERANSLVTFLDSHDMARFKADHVPDRSVELALVFLLTSRGVPAVYYGTEQYMSGEKDPHNRETMRSFSETTVAFRAIRTLAALRRRNPALAYGTTSRLSIGRDAYVFERRFGSSVAVVAINRDLERSFPVRGIVSSLPTGLYPDALEGLLGGRPTMSADGRLPDFELGPGAAAVWHDARVAPPEEAEPLVGHVGPPMGRAGGELAIGGSGFGPRPGAVLFGGAELPDDHVLSWSDSAIRARVPGVPGGRYEAGVRTAAGRESRSPAGGGFFEVLSGEQMAVRFVVRRAWTEWGENVFVAGDVSELGGWNPERAIGPFANQVLFAYPDWYCDVSVPAGAEIRFKFLKRNGSSVRWESGPDRRFRTPRSGTATVTCDWR